MTSVFVPLSLPFVGLLFGISGGLVIGKISVVSTSSLLVVLKFKRFNCGITGGMEGRRTTLIGGSGIMGGASVNMVGLVKLGGQGRSGIVEWLNSMGTKIRVAKKMKDMKSAMRRLRS